MLKKWTFTLATIFANISSAGDLGTPIPDYQGFWVGVGGSYNYSTLSGKTNITQVSNTPSSAQFLLSDNLSNHMSPVANAGYYYALPQNWYLGAKFLYKYIGQEQFDQNLSETFTDGSYQTAGIRTKFVQDFYLLASGGYAFESWLVYAGAGPSWATARIDLNGDVLPPSSLTFTPVNISKSQTILGGAAQVGFEYMLPHRFAVDISYSFLVTPTTSLPSLDFNTTTNVGYTRITQSISVVEQGINITINKYF